MTNRVHIIGGGIKAYLWVLKTPADKLLMRKIYL